MKRYYKGKEYKKFTLVILFAVFCLAATACNIQDSSGYAVQPGESRSEGDVPEKDIYKDGNAKIQVYTMDPDSLEAEEAMVTVKTGDSGGLTAQIIVDAVLELFEAQGEDIGINAVEQEENTVIVDFDGQKAPVVHVGSAEETAILNCISMSLLDNLDDCQQVVFHIDGDRYESGHYGFELNEAYKWKN